MLKLSENPPVLSPGVESLLELQGRWWVAHTKSRFEKAFAWDLHREGIGYFLPLFECVRTNGGRKRHVMKPLFPGYVFFCGDAGDRYKAMTTDRLCQTIDVLDQEKLVAELSAIEKALNAKVQLDPYPFAVVGQRCRVKSGPFVGMEGIVVQRNCTARLVLGVSVLGQGAVLEIDTDMLEPVDSEE